MHALSPYPDPDARDAELHAVCEELGAQVVTYGESADGRPLRAARLLRAGLPRVMVCANIHGVEYVGNRVAMGFLRSLAGSPLAERAEVWVAPCLNPDGYARTWAQQGNGRVGELRGNARGVDLNRNFPLPWGATPSWLPASGSSAPGAATYRGEAPLSEPETRHLAALLATVDAHASVSLHSFMGTVIPPPVRHREDRVAYRALTKALIGAQRHARYRRLSSPLDVFTGELEDYQHHVLGTWAVCLETFTLPATLRQHLWAPSVFWRFNPRDPRPWVDSDVAGIHAFLQASLDRPRPPRRAGAQPRFLAEWRAR